MNHEVTKTQTTFFHFFIFSFLCAFESLWSKSLSIHLERVSKARIGALIHAKSNFAASPFTLLACQSIFRRLALLAWFVFQANCWQFFALNAKDSLAH